MKGATSIQERLWELRKDKGLNLEELSELTGISKSALGSYEKEDYKEINHGNLITLADFYGVSVDYLLCRTENREQINTPLTELHLNDEILVFKPLHTETAKASIDRPTATSNRSSSPIGITSFTGSCLCPLYNPFSCFLLFLHHFVVMAFLS